MMGIGREEAISVGRAFGQNAIVYGVVHHPPELVDCRVR
jgi:hypothetical protein